MRCTTSSAIVVGDARLLQGRAPDRMAEPGAERDDQFQRAGDAEDDADAVAVERRGPAP